MNPGNISVLFNKRKGANGRWRLFCCLGSSVRFGQESLSGINEIHNYEGSVSSELA